MNRLFLFSGCTLFTFLQASAQPSYYESRARQTAEYKTLSNATSKAYSTSGSNYNAPKSQSSSTPVTTSTASSNRNSNPVTITNNNNGYSNIGAGDKVRRQIEAGERNEARAKEQEAIISAGEVKYRKLIAGMGIAKTEEDLYDLVLTGMRNGIDLRAVYKVIGKNLAQYKSIWGEHPDKPFLPSDGRVQEAMFSLRVINAPGYNGDMRAYHLLQIAKAYPTKDNLHRAAEACLVEGRYQEAIYRYEDVLKLKAGDFDATSGMAAAQAFLNFLQQSESSFQSISNQNDNSDIFINLAWVQMLQGKTKEALQSAVNAADLDPIHPGFKIIQSSLETNTAAAQALSDKATELLPQLGTGNLVSKFLNMTKFLHKENAYQESIIYLDFAVRLEPKNLDLLELRYATNLKIRRDGEALKDERTINSL